MERSRAARRERVRSRRKQLLIAAAVCAGLAVLLAAGTSASRLYRSSTPQRRTSKSASAEVATESIVPASSAATETPVEVPNVTGRNLAEAQLVLQTAGFVVVSKGETMTAEGRPANVVAQSPPPGTRLAQGQQVSITLSATGTPAARPLLVVLDPGHQAKADLTPEPVGPGSPEKKEKATAGACGVATKRQECEVALEVAAHVKARLEAAGIDVIMTRTTNAVDLGNMERADVANKSGADLFVRIHSDAGANPGLRGVSVLYPGGNAWVSSIAAPSRKAATEVDRAMVAATSAFDGGVVERADLAGFNWCRVPAILVETGYLSNEDDDRSLANPGYQDKLAAGIVNGIVTYFGR